MFFSHEGTTSDLMGPGPLQAYPCYQVDGVKWSLLDLTSLSKSFLPLMRETMIDRVL